MAALASDPKGSVLDERASQIGHEIAMAIAAGQATEPFSTRLESFGVEDAYRAAAVARRLKGRVRKGLKIGFTNRAIWPLYGVDAPIWGAVTADTLRLLEQGIGAASISGLSEPRVEPEIVLILRASPAPDLPDHALANCVGWAAPAFELVQSIYPDWRFATADAAAANGLHGRLLIGPRTPVTPEACTALAETPVRLSKSGAAIEDGVGANALDGPLSALRHLVELLAADPDAEPLRAGDVISTGTLTDAQPVAAGEVWRAEFGAPLGAIELTLTA